MAAISQAIGNRVEGDDRNANDRAVACFRMACIELAHINNDGVREAILDKIGEAAKDMVAKTRASMLEAPEDH